MPFNSLSISKKLTQPYNYFIVMAFAIFCDITLTWYGITYGNSTHYLNEGNGIAGYIINNFGWEGVGITYFILMLMFMYFLKISDLSKKYVQYIMLGLCVIHIAVPINNAIIILR